MDLTHEQAKTAHEAGVPIQYKSHINDYEWFDLTDDTLFYVLKAFVFRTKPQTSKEIEEMSALWEKDIDSVEYWARADSEWQAGHGISPNDFDFYWRKREVEEEIIELATFDMQASITGNLIATYVKPSFKSKEEFVEFIENKTKEFDNTTVTYTDILIHFQIGDKVYVSGDGGEEYTITGMKKYSDYSYGYTLDSGWVEPVYKCYAPKEEQAMKDDIIPDDKQTSDGSTASYYELPENATELQHLISAKNMNAQIGEIFRACYRYGQVSHSPMLRDAKKIKFYIEAEIERLEKIIKDNPITGVK